MSAIWGAIDFSNKEISEKTKDIFREAFADCVIDRTEELSEAGVYMGCGIQYITPESIGEKLPCKSGERFFAADVIVDNRADMCEKLGVENTSELPDGEILKGIYYKYGKESFNMLLGAYTFVDYNRENKTVDIVSDAVGNRFVYYIIVDGILYFSSIMKPLEQIIPERRLNKRWASDFLGFDGLSAFETSEDTSLEGLDRIAPAMHIRINDGKILSKNLYWDVQKIRRKRKTKTDEEYKEQFISLYKACVGDVLRANGETAILLSGGYDSTSVACLAAPILKERGKKLYSFTAVPLKEYVSDKPVYMETDETESVKKTAAFLGNVEMGLVNLQDINLWEARKDYMKVCEIPYKSTQNLLWMFQSYKDASAKGARIILSGSFGNGTVSFDNSYQYLVWLLRHLKLKKYMFEVNAIHRRYHTSRKETVKKTLKGVVSGVKISERDDKAYSKSYITKELLESSGVKERIEAVDKECRRVNNNPHKYQLMFFPNSNFRHYGEYQQKNSLHTGVVLRDPTRDKRMIEFVASAPFDQFFHNANRRRLISEYMKDLMPDGYFTKHPVGIQSADMKLRYKKYEEVIMPEWKKLASEYSGKNVIDTDKMRECLNGKVFDDMEDFDIYRLFYTLNLLEYIQNCRM